MLCIVQVIFSTLLLYLSEIYCTKDKQQQTKNGDNSGSEASAVNKEAEKGEGLEGSRIIQDSVEERKKKEGDWEQSKEMLRSDWKMVKGMGKRR